MTRRLLICGLVASVFALVQPATAQTFPRLGGYLIGGNIGSLTPAHVAPLDVVILGAYKGWTNNQGLNASQFAAQAKAINPNLKLFVYTVIESDTQNPPRDPGLAPIASTPWWLYEAGTSGTIVNNLGGAPLGINITTYGRTLNGKDYPTWRAQYDNSILLSSFPAVDGIFVDNVFSAPRANADWTLSGSSQQASNPTVQHIYRLGYVAYFAALRAAAASTQQMITGNVADWYENKYGMANITDYQGLLQGGVIESIIGESYSYETWGGWATMMAAYTSAMNALGSPKYAIFSVDGSATDYQTARYALASALLGDGYFFYNNCSGCQNYNDYVTFDEFNANLGTATTAALVFPGATAWQHGVYRRDFENGIALVNPKGNGPQTVTLETSYKHLSGTQAPSVNNGQTVTSVTLNDRDGVILLRLTSQTPPPSPVPEPPTQISVH